MDLKSQLKQSLQINFSQDLKQSLKILEMSNLELRKLIESLSDNNPFLEIEEINYNSQNEILPSQKSRENVKEFFENQYREKDLITFLEEQFIGKFSSTNYEIARYLCSFLDEKGYFKGDIESIAIKLQVKRNKIINILKILKTLEPTGIFAENLEECLKLQLEEKGMLDESLKVILCNLNLVANAEFYKLSKVANINLEEVMEKINLIKQLDPKPGNLFASETSISIIPDLILTFNESEFNIEINEETLPKIFFKRDYYQSLKLQVKDQEGKIFLSQSSKEIINFMRHLKQRSATLLLVTHEIISEQIKFFTHGINFLKPLTINSVAEKLYFHPSTISRVTKNKYMSCSLGIFELRYFFSKGIEGKNKVDSNKIIKQEIFNIINCECIDNIYSDDNIALILAEKDYKISRRTVVKYREELKIPNSNIRKKQKLLKNI